MVTGYAAWLFVRMKFILLLFVGLELCFIINSTNCMKPFAGPFSIACFSKSTALATLFFFRSFFFLWGPNLHRSLQLPLPPLGYQLQKAHESRVLTSKKASQTICRNLFDLESVGFALFW